MKKTIKGRIGGNKNGKSTNNSAPTADNFSSASINANNDKTQLRDIINRYECPLIPHEIIENLK